MFKKKRRKKESTSKKPVILSPLDNRLPKRTTSHVGRSILGAQDANSVQSEQQPPSSQRRNPKRRLQIIDDNFEAVDSPKRSRWRLAMSPKSRL